MVSFREKQGNWFTNQALLLSVRANYCSSLFSEKNETFGCEIRMNRKILIF